MRMERLKIIDYQLGVADNKIRLLSRLNPTNAKKEKKKFLHAYKKGQIYNPFLNFRSVNVDLDKIEKGLKSIKFNVPHKGDEQQFLAKYLEEKRKRSIKKIGAVKHRGTPSFNKYSKELFARPSPEQLSYAKKHLTPEACIKFSEIKNTIPSQDAAQILQKYIEEARLPWRTKLSGVISSRAGIDSRGKFLIIKKGEFFSPEEIESLAVHEIETHIFRKENGEKQSLPRLFGQGFAGPPTIEEGLAFFNETQQPVHDPRRFLVICARTLASEMALHKSFFDTFDYLVKRGLPEEYAWSTTLRTKRGFRDTSKPGSFPKDHHYLKGYLQVKKYFDEGGDMQSLYIGGVGLLTAKSIKDFGIKIKAPYYIPRYLVNGNTRPKIT